MIFCAVPQKESCSVIDRAEMCMQATSSALVRAGSPYFLSETRLGGTVVCFRERLINANVRYKLRKHFFKVQKIFSLWENQCQVSNVL